MNSINLVGRLVVDPEARQTHSGVSQSKFRVAVTRDFKNAEGKYEADFINVVAWKGTADFCNRYLTKGRLVEISGRVQTGRYEDKNGVTHNTFDVIVGSIRPLERGNDGAGKRQAAAVEEEPTLEERGFEEVADGDDELPF